MAWIVSSIDDAEKWFEVCLMSKMYKTWHLDEEMMNRDGSKVTVGTGRKLGRTLKTREGTGRKLIQGADNWPSLKRKRKTTIWSLRNEEL